MTEQNSRYNPLLELLEAVTNINIGNYDDQDVDSDESSYVVISRGLPLNERTKREEIQSRLKLNQRRKTMIQKVESLKDIIQQREESKGITVMASLINEILDPNQKRIFMMELDGQKDTPYSNYIPITREVQNPYINSNHHNEMQLIARGAEPCNSILRDTNLESMNDIGEPCLDPMNIHGDYDSVKLPIEKKYNSSEVYMIHKGIKYCRMQLTKFNSIGDSTFIRELKSKSVLNIIMNENINNKNNYTMNLANNYPKTFEEIKFILLEDKDLILKSSFFVNIAQKNIQLLYDLLLKLFKVMDKNELSRACDQSRFNGVSVANVLQNDLPPEMKSNAESINRFLNRYKQGPMF